MQISTQPISAQSIQHLADNSVLDANSISATTKQLSASDSTIIAAFNGLLTELKSLPLAVPVVIPPTSLQAGSSAILGNFRIPTGYTASVVNAIIATPVSGQQVSLAVI